MVTGEIVVSQTEETRKIEALIEKHFQSPVVERRESDIAFLINYYGEVYSDEVEALKNEIASVTQIEEFEFELNGDAENIRYQLSADGTLKETYGTVVYDETLDAERAWEAFCEALLSNMLEDIFMETLGVSRELAENTVQGCNNSSNSQTVKVSFGMLWESWGEQEVEIPRAELHDMSRESILDWLNNHLSELSLPRRSEYVDESAQIDEDGVLKMSDDGQNWTEI